MSAVAISPDGLYRWSDIKDLVPVSRETWRKRVIDGTAPAPVQLSPRCTCYRGEDLLLWLQDPIGYRRDPAEKQ